MGIEMGIELDSFGSLLLVLTLELRNPDRSFVIYNPNQRYVLLVS